MAAANPGNINTSSAGSLPPGTSGMVPAQAQHPNYGQNVHEFSLRSKVLLGMLKVAVENVIDIATKSIVQNSAVDSGVTLGRAPENEEMSECRFEKSLEEFYATCNQIEIHLRTILECTIQTRDSNNFLPFSISKDIEVPLGTVGTVTYADYLNIIKKQVSYTKSVFDILSDSARQVRGEPPVMPPQQTLQQQQQHQLPPMQMPQQQQLPLQHMGSMSVGQSMSHQIQHPPQ